MSDNIISRAQLKALQSLWGLHARHSLDAAGVEGAAWPEVSHLEQAALSRGLLENEVREIAVRELGNGQPAKLTEKQVQMFVSASRVDDVFARGADGRLAPQKYLSVRRLVKTLRQLKAAKEKSN